MTLGLVVQSLKGGSGSGYFGHFGRPGKIGGSTMQGGAVNPYDIDTTPGDEVIMGKEARKWFAMQQALSDQWREEELAKFRKAKVRTEMTEDDLDGYLRRLSKHRRYILDEGMNILADIRPKIDEKEFMRRLMMHDRDKYDYNTAEAYVGKFKFDPKDYQEAHSAAHTMHVTQNDHHFEFWAKGGTPQRIPPAPFWELMADWRGTARQQRQPHNAYYDKFGKDIPLHPATRKQLEFELEMLRPIRRKKSLYEFIQSLSLSHLTLS